MIRYREFLLTVCVLAAVTCGTGGNGPRVLKCSLILGDNSDWYRGAEKFKELVEELSGGRYAITLYPHAQLANGVQRTELEMVQSGVIDMSLESSILLSLIEPRMSVFSMPWMFRYYSQAHEVLDSALGRRMLEMLPQKELVGLAYGTNGFRQITNSRSPLREPGDLKALKIRVPDIRMYIDIFRLLGADPSSMSFGELFTALAQGTMDGQENPVSVIYSARLYEVQKYLTVWNYSYDPIILCMNRTLWESLSPEMQKLFLDCAGEAMSYERDLVVRGESALLDSLRARGMSVHTPGNETLAAFRALVEPIYDKYAGEIGVELLRDFRKTLNE